MRVILISLLFSLAAPLAAQAQSNCDSKQTEEEYQKCIERGGNNKTYDPKDWGQGNVTTPDAQPIEEDIIDPLPPESRRQIRKEMAKKVYAEVGEWTPEARKKSFEYEPSEAAKSDPELKAQEEAAFAAAVSDYHDREQMAAENGGGGQQDGEDSGSGGNVNVAGEVNTPGGTGQGGSSGQSRDVYDILGDLNVIGEPAPGSETSSQTQAGNGSAGETIEIAGDVTIGGESSGGGAQSSAGTQDADAGAAGAPSGGQAGQAGTQQAENAADDAFGQLNPPSNEDPAASTGSPAQGGKAQDGPPPTPPRPIPPADPTSAQILADLFKGEDAQEREITSAAPFVDWTNPDANLSSAASSAQNTSAIEQAAQSLAQTPQPAAQSVEAATQVIKQAPPAEQARAAQKEQARIAYKERQLASSDLSSAEKAALAADIAARKAALSDVNASAVKTGAPAASTEADARLLTLSLP